MTKNHLAQFEKLVKEEVALFRRKNKDYTGEGDTLGNFKRVSKILSNYPKLRPKDPTTICIIYMCKQFDAVLYALSHKVLPQGESLESRLRDIAVYAKLLMLLCEEEFPPSPTDQ